MKIPRWATGEHARKLLMIPPLVFGVVAYGWFVSGQAAPERRGATEATRTLRVIAVPEVDVIPRVIGHGTAEPGQVWRAISEVKGRVVHVHPRLAPGALMKAGEELLRIDPTEYELAVAQLEADIQQTNAQLAELESKSSNFNASLKIEKESLALAEKELKRYQSMERQNAASDSEVDAKERDVLNQRQSIQNLENSINLVPAETKSLQAALAVKQTNLKQANVDLEKTTISVPFDCRLGELTIEIGQFLAAGETLFEAHSTAVTEVEAQVAPHNARRLVDKETAPTPTKVIENRVIPEAYKFGVTVRFRSGDATAEWTGRVDRLREQLDTQTRTFGIVVAVDNPYAQVVPGVRPALVRGMYCEVEFRGNVHKSRAVIPRSSLHDGHVYVIDAENRLRRQKVDIDFAQANFVCLRSGLNSGDTLVVSDPTPAIEGMLVEPFQDADLRQSLIQEASGE